MTTLFVYGTSLPGHPDHRWIVGLPLTPATVRGALWRGPRNRPALVPAADGRPIRGALVDVDDGRLAVMDLVEGAGEGPLQRERVTAAANLRAVPAEAWVLHKPPRGWRRLSADAWGTR
jgi:gamma-glutamylcyclotransferase (GGCT)/AIG2-like uncharacterized protein YtfP